MATDALKTIAVPGHGHGKKSTLIEAADTEFLVGKEATPLEYLLGSLAARINVIGHLVARGRGIVIRGLDGTVTGDIDPAKFRGEAHETRAGFQTVRVEVAVDTDANQTELDAWLDAVAERCPVADNLRHPSELALSVSHAPAAEPAQPQRSRRHVGTCRSQVQPMQ